MICVLVGTVACQGSDDYSSFFSQPSETAKIVEEKFYKPILYNGKWICGEEIGYYFGIWSPRPDVKYYDEKGRLLLEDEPCDSVWDSRRAYRYVYYDSLLYKTIYRIFEKEGEEKEICKHDYIRDDDGRLLKITPCEYYSPIDACTFEYDSKGNRIKEINEDDETTTLFFTSPSDDKDIEIKRYEKYSEDNQYSYKYKQGIDESGINIYDTKTGRVMMSKKECYRYGKLHSAETHVYEYDAEGLLIEEMVNKSSIDDIHRVPADLFGEELDEYIKEHYYGIDAEYKDYHEIHRWKYNEYGDYTGHYNLPPRDWTNKYFSMDIRTEIPNVIKKRIERNEQKGIRVIILPPPYCRSSFKLNSVTIDLLTHKLSALGIGFTCPPNKMCYSDSIFYDSPYHLLEKGTILHTKNVIKQIKTAL